MSGGLSPYLADRLSSHSSAGSLQREFTGMLLCMLLSLSHVEQLDSCFSAAHGHDSSLLVHRNLQRAIVGSSTAVVSGYSL